MEQLKYRSTPYPSIYSSNVVGDAAEEAFDWLQQHQALGIRGPSHACLRSARICIDKIKANVTNLAQGNCKVLL